MEIRKTYDIKQIADYLQNEIEVTKERDSAYTRIDITIAQDILEVLVETFRREARHQTLESALSFIEKEDGTQTNEMELAQNPTSDTKRNACKKPNCFGKYEEEYSCSWSCEDCAYETECYLLHKKKATRKGNKKDE